MRILFVINNIYTEGNGLSGSCRRTVKLLRDAGEDVRLLSAGGGHGEAPDFPLPDGRIPVFQPIIRKQGYAFAKSDEAVIRQAVRWADVVHLEEPFGLQIRVCRIAEEEGRPLTATYHLHPENLFSSVHLQWSLWFNQMTLLVWKRQIFDRCRIVQCPTENVRKRLESAHCRSELRVISNGMLRDVRPAPASPVPREDGTFLIVSTGRYSVEKDQSTLLRAMRYTKYADRIRLVLAGQGPTEKRLRREAAKLLREGVLKKPVIFGFHSLPELLALYRQADLYVHCAKVEVEGMSCMEAVQTGLVPIIAEGKLTATAQFALHSDSLYPAGDAKALAQKIDFWLSDAERRQAEAARYLALIEDYSIDRSIAQLREMFRDALEN